MAMKRPQQSSPSSEVPKHKKTKISSQEAMTLDAGSDGWTKVEKRKQKKVKKAEIKLDVCV